jgi:hypothetical protein
MKPMLMTAIVVTVMLGAPWHSSAQQANGFAGVVFAGTENPEYISGATIGGVHDLAKSWVSVGGQADILVKNGYVGGRVGPVAQANFLRNQAVRLFAIGGMAWGVEGGPMFGAGVDMWSSGRVGFRATVSDYVRYSHKPSFQFSVAWR